MINMHQDARYVQYDPKLQSSTACHSQDPQKPPWMHDNEAQMGVDEICVVYAYA